MLTNQPYAFERCVINETRRYIKDSDFGTSVGNEFEHERFRLFKYYPDETGNSVERKTLRIVKNSKSF